MLKLKAKKIVGVISAAVVILSMPVFASASETVADISSEVNNSAYETLDSDFYAAIAAKDEAIESLKAARFTYPAYHVVETVKWQQQINSYFCGPATASMILSSFMGNNSPTQNQISTDRYLRTTLKDGTPWYSGGDGMEAEDPKYYNMPYSLNLWQTNKVGKQEWTYTPYPYNFESTTDQKYIDNIKFTLYMGNPSQFAGSRDLKALSVILTGILIKE